MPGGQTTTNQASATMPVLNQIFASQFGQGGAGTTGLGTLTGFASGSGIDALNKSLTASNNQTLKSSIGQMKEAFGSSGMGSSSSLSKQIGATINQNQTNLTSTLAGADLQAQGQQLSAASLLSQIFSGAATNFFNSQSKTQQSGTSTFEGVFSTLFPGGL